MDYLRSLLLALAPFLSNPQHASVAIGDETASSADTMSTDIDVDPATLFLARPANFMGHLAFKILRMKDPYIFRSFAADCVTLLRGTQYAFVLISRVFSVSKVVF